MKLAAKRMLGNQAPSSPLRQRKTNPFFEPPDWERTYEGFPNTLIKDVFVDENNTALVTLETSDGRIFHREVSNLEYVIGRRGSLDYLNSRLWTQVLDNGSHSPAPESHEISSRTLRAKVEENLEVTPNVFVIGSLTGDSLIRFAYGGCVFAAREIMKRHGDGRPKSKHPAAHPSLGHPDALLPSISQPLEPPDPNNDYIVTNGHSSLDTEKQHLRPQPVDARWQDLNAGAVLAGI